MITAANRLAGTDYSRYLAVDEIDAETIKAAREIFDRLQAEAAADEAAKQAEIEAALRAANDAG